MKHIGALLLAIALAAGVNPAFGKGSHSSHSYSYSTGHVNPSAHYVRPYVTKKGTVVQGHMQTNPNGTKLDNYSTKGNVNPYTGKPGTKNP
jgi:hypothetical protein